MLVPTRGAMNRCPPVKKNSAHCAEYLSVTPEGLIHAGTNPRGHESMPSGKKNSRTMCGISFLCDPGGIQTPDLQNRNLTFYSTELRGRIKQTSLEAKIDYLHKKAFELRIYKF
jgi:hypothetical protein